MMSKPTETATAKEKVLDWVRSKNPSTMELKFGCRCRSKESGHETICIGEPKGESRITSDRGIYYFDDEGHTEILGSDMGLQELLIALRKVRNSTSHEWMILHGNEELTPYDLTKNLHNQSDSFYEGILPLLPTP